jgi:hypothetical protein
MRFHSISILLLATIVLSKDFKLSNNWRNLTLLSHVARSISTNQNNCTNEIRRHNLNSYGMGSGIMTTSKAFCNALQLNSPVHITGSKWLWNDEKLCLDFMTPESQAGFTCYFGAHISKCASDSVPMGSYRLIPWEHIDCPDWISHRGNISDVYAFKAGYVEYLFSRMNPQLVAMAEATAHKVFGRPKAPNGLITVHIR